MEKDFDTWWDENFTRKTTFKDGKEIVSLFSKKHNMWIADSVEWKDDENKRHHQINCASGKVYSFVFDSSGNMIEHKV